MSLSRVIPHITIVTLLLASHAAMAGNPNQLPFGAGRPTPSRPIDIPARPQQVRPYPAPNIDVRPGGNAQQAGPARVPAIPRPQQARPPSPWGFFPGDV